MNHHFAQALRTRLKEIGHSLQENDLGARLQLGEPLARYTSARLGGPAEALLSIHSAAELSQVVQLCWAEDWPFTILGGGSNVLVSDRGLPGLTLLNRARHVEFSLDTDPPTVRAESGANFGALARQAASHGLSGLEWAIGIPGTLGGAVVGNAGAHGADMAANLLLAEILQRSPSGEVVQAEWPVDRLAYGYRTSILKASATGAVVLAAHLHLEHGVPGAVQAKMDAFTEQRRRTQPPGATMGSMFKNPPGDFAGRLIDAAGLKGTVVGDAQISPLHGNFFINRGQATAQDLYALIHLARQTVYTRFGVQLELEIELLGEWS